MPRHSGPPQPFAESLSGARPVFILAVACGTEWCAAWLPAYGGPGDRLAMTVIGAAVGWLAFVVAAHYQLDRATLTLRARAREWLADRAEPGYPQPDRARPGRHHREEDS